MKIWHISDTHGYHSLLFVPKDINMVIHSGDFSDKGDVYKNEPETRDFLRWYGNLEIKHKILIAGNHDAFAFINGREFKDLCKYYGIIYLENTDVIIDGIKIFGTPISPTYGNWYFMKSRDKMDRVWSNLGTDIDILVTHTPPKGILDMSFNRNSRELERCGCNALRKHILERIKPKLNLFGHIHNCEDLLNAGVMKLSAHDTQFSNGSVVKDGRFGTLFSNGNIIDFISW